MNHVTRRALSGSAITGALLLSAAPAQAACVVVAGAVTCGTTITTNTTYAGPVPSVPPHAVDRNYDADTATADFTGTVSTGAAITGNGLAFTNTGAGGNDLIVVNDGSVQVDAGQAPTAGGTGALSITALGATNVSYSGAGDVINLGTSGNGLEISTSGTGDIVANVGGDVTSAVGGNGVYALSSGTSGDITVTTAAGTLVSADLIGVFAQVTAPTSDGAISITNNANIGSLAGPADITHGVAANNFGTGSITIANNGDIGSATDVPIGAGVLGQLFNTASTADVTLSNTGDIYVVDAALAGYNDGQGDISIGNSGALTSTTSAGIYAQQAGTGTTGGVVVTNSGAINAGTHGIQTSNAGTGGVAITNSGAITAVGMGIRARGLSATQTGNISVLGNGAITSGSTGIWAATAGTGTVTVNYTGAITTTAGDGIEATGTTGALSVTSGAITAVGGDGILTSTTTGNQTITVGGNVTSDAFGVNANSDTGNITVNVTGGNVFGASAGIAPTTDGNMIVNVSATRTVSGAEGISSSGVGTLTVNNSGTITGTGGDAIITSYDNATTVNNNVGGVINGDLDLSNLVDTVNNRGTLNSLGGSFFYAGNDVVSNQLGGIINLDGTVDFGTGTDAFTNTLGSTLNITANSTLTGLETLTLNGTVTMAAGTSLTGTGPFVNGGTFDTAGSATLIGFTAVTNNGLMDLAAGTLTVPAVVFTNSATGVIAVDEGATTITGQTSFVNNGALDLIDGAIGDQLTINSAYTGPATGRLQVDVSGTTADRLVINGNVTGITAIDVNTVGLGAFDPDGILVVDVTGAFTSTDGAFVIGEEVGNPLINFDVEKVGQDFYLVTLLDPETAFVPLAATGLLREMWYQSADEVFAHTLSPLESTGLSVWATAYGSQRRTGATNSVEFNDVQYDADNNIELDRYGFQGGVGYSFGFGQAGITGGYASAQANGDGEFDADGWNIGLYGKFGGLTGFHAEALFKHDSYDVEFDGVFDGNDVDASSTGIDGSVGYRFPIGIVPSIDVNAGLSHVWSDMDDVSAFGFDYDFDDMTSTRGRLGVRGNFGGDYNPYLGATLYKEFDGDGDVRIANGAVFSDLASGGNGTWVRFEGGLAGGRGTHGLNIAAWVDAGDTRGAGLRAGFRF